jgi:hypothetical protein
MQTQFCILINERGSVGSAFQFPQNSISMGASCQNFWDSRAVNPIKDPILAQDPDVRKAMKRNRKGQDFRATAPIDELRNWHAILRDPSRTAEQEQNATDQIEAYRATAIGKPPKKETIHRKGQKYSITKQACSMTPREGYLLGLGEIILGGTIMFTGGVLELASFGFFTIGFIATEAAGATLIGHGLSLTTANARDMSRNMGSYPMTKNDPGAPQSREVQDKQFRDAMKEVEKKLERPLRPEDIRKLHDHVSGQGYGYHEMVEEGYWVLGGS